MGAFSAAEAARFASLAGPDTDGPLAEAVAWEVLYRVEPRLYDRWAAAEKLHRGILDWLPDHPRRVVEVGAGSGRLTLELAPRCGQLIAAEPARGLRTILRRRLRGQAAFRAEVVDAVAERLPVPDAWADLVVACSVLTPEDAHGGNAGLLEMERVCAPGGMVVIVWPNHLEWLAERGYSYISFPGEMWLEFRSAAEAIELTQIFYPLAVDEVQRRGQASVPYSLIGVNPPRDLAYKVAGA